MMATEQLSELGESALRHLKCGRSVFPVGTDKKPLVRWGDYQTEKPTESNVRAWWTQWPDANIGMACGPVSGFVVLDIDNEQGLQALQQQGLTLPDTLVVKTGRGWHYYFQDPGVKTKNFARGKREFPIPCVDFRGFGGYAIVPVSRHANGHIYRVEKKGPAVTLPDWLLELVSDHNPAQTQPAERPIHNGNRNPLAEKILAKAVAQAGEGTRNETGLWLACQLRDNGFTEAEAESSLLRYAATVRDRGSHPYLDSEALETLQSAFRRPAREGWTSMQGAESVKAAFEGMREQPQAEPSPVPIEIIPLDTPTLPEWPPDLFPGWFQEYVNAVAAHTETPIELPAAMGLAVLGTACQKILRVLPRAEYSEPLNLWIQAALDSGNRKSAVLSAMTRPLLNLERERGKAAQGRIAEIQSQRDTMQARVKVLRSRAATAESEESGQLTKEIAALEGSLPIVPQPPRLWAQDVTPEKLASMLADNNEKMAILSAEGGLFDMMAGRYSNGIPNLDLYLQSHSGDSVHVDRKNGASIFLREPALTIGLSSQPEVLRSLAKKEGFRGRGLLARFLYVLPPSRLGYRTMRACPIPPSVETAYHHHLRALLDREAPLNEQGDVVPYLLTFSEAARREWEDFAQQLEVGMREGGRYDQIKDWAGKLPGQAARIAGLIHSAEHAIGQPWLHPISLDTMQRALAAAAVLVDHALAVFDLMGADPALNVARKVWTWIERARHRTFTARECHRALRGSFPHVADILPGFTALLERGYLLEPGIPSRTEAGRPSRVFTVNPAITKEWP